MYTFPPVTTLPPYNPQVRSGGSLQGEGEGGGAGQGGLLPRLHPSLHLQCGGGGEEPRGQGPPTRGGLATLLPLELGGKRLEFCRHQTIEFAVIFQ